MEDKLEKQNYLRSEIIQQGYNQDDFLTFLEKKKAIDEVDIDCFTLQQLKEVIL